VRLKTDWEPALSNTLCKQIKPLSEESRKWSGSPWTQRGVSPIGKEKAYGGKDLPKSQVLSSEWKTVVVTDSGDGGEGGGDELPCATKGEGGEMR